MWPAVLFWRPTNSNHSILRAFKFRNPRVEQTYQDHSNGVRVFVAAAYFIFSCLLITVSCSSFSDNSSQPIAFWCLIALDILQAIALMALCTFRSMRQRVVLLHAVVVMISVLMLSYLSLAYADNWLNVTVANLQKGYSANLVADMSSILRIILGNQGRTSMVLGSQYHLISLTFIGYNHTTIPIWTSFFISFLVVTITAPYRAATYITLFSCELFLQTIPFPLLCICIEVLQRRNFQAQQELKRELEISQMAESMLNNTVNNVLADAVANIQEFLNAGCQASDSLLRETLTRLARGMRSCRQRQAFLALVSDTYEPRFLQVNLRDFGEELVAGRAVAGDFADAQVLLDPLLCNLVLENAIAQAFRHGHQEAPDVRVRVFPQGSFRGDGLLFTADLAVTRGVVQAVFEVSFVGSEGGVELFDGGESFQLRPGSPTAHYMTQRHLKLAADAHKMTVQWLQEAGRIIFRGTCKVAIAEQQRRAEPPPRCVLDAFPSGLTFYIMDDSVAARRLLASCIIHMAAPAAVHCYGTYPEDVHQFVGAASQDADIVICDQHLDYGDQHYLGSDLIRSLRDRGFRGLLCMRSGDMNDHDRELYRASGAHCMFGKEELAHEVVNHIKEAYVELKALGQPDGISLSPFSASHDGEAPPQPSRGLSCQQRGTSHRPTQPTVLSTLPTPLALLLGRGLRSILRPS